ncbi:MAG: hypothetical protein OSA93_13515 [Akkermansiaceae bacterium]|jgi:hypothetical protein|nr:hypothetical protein [Akkermansiaceae bacterium]
MSPLKGKSLAVSQEPTNLLGETNHIHEQSVSEITHHHDRV